MPIMPGAIWRPVPSNSGPMSAHLGLVLHVQVGNGSCYGEFSNPANQASSTWWIAKDGTFEQYVDSDNAAWTEAAGNFTWDSVETEGVPSDPLTPQQVLTLARIYAWGARQYGWPLQLSEDPGTRGLGWHGMGGAAWGGHTGCPGDLRKAQRAQALYLAALALHPQPAEEFDMKFSAYDPVTGGNWLCDENGALFAPAFPGDAAPYVTGLNAHPNWGAGTAETGGANPCVGIEYWGHPGQADGIVFYTKPANGVGGIAGTPYSAYRVKRDGSPA